MPKTSPERLAAALRANLKRRKAPKAAEGPPEPINSAPATDGGSFDKAPLMPVEKAKTPPSAKG